MSTLPLARAGLDARRRNLWPLPGGVDGYVESVRTMLGVALDGPDRATFQRRASELFPQVSSTSTIRGYTGVLVTLGFVAVQAGGLVAVTPDGARFARSSDLRILRRALYGRVYGVAEVLNALTVRAMAYPELLAVLEEQGVSWGNPMALRYRVWWLRAGAALSAERRMRADWLRPTPAGRALVQPRRGNATPMDVTGAG